MEMKKQHSPLTFITAGMQACWLYTALLIMAVKTGAGERLSPTLLLSIYPISWALNGVLRRRPWPWIGRAAASVACWLFFTLALDWWLLSSTTNLLDISWLAAFASGVIHLPSFPNQEQLILVSCGLLWWLGKRLAALPRGFSTLITEFQFGLAILLILFFLASQWQMSLPGLVLVCLAFFVFSFVGISLAHADEGKGWLYGTERSHWLTILFFAIFLVFGLGLLVSAVIRPELLKTLFSLAKLFWGFVADLIAMIIAFLASLMPKSDPVPLPPPGGAPVVVPPEPPAWVELLRLPEWVRRAGQIAVSSIWIILILAALWSLSSQIIHWLRHKLDHSEGATYEPLRGAFREDLLHLLRMMLKGLTRIFAFFRPRRRRSDSLSREAASVRQIYRRLTDWAASAGCPRHAAQTPAEYLPALAGWLPEGRLEFSLITEQYMFVRYSPHLPASDTVESVVKAWDRLKGMKREVRKRQIKNAHPIGNTK